MKKLFLFIIPFLFFGCVTTGTFEVSSDGKTLLSYGCEGIPECCEKNKFFTNYSFSKDFYDPNYVIGNRIKNNLDKPRRLQNLPSTLKRKSPILEYSLDDNIINYYVFDKNSIMCYSFKLEINYDNLKRMVEVTNNYTKCLSNAIYWKDRADIAAQPMIEKSRSVPYTAYRSASKPVTRFRYNYFTKQNEAYTDYEYYQEPYTAYRTEKYMAPNPDYNPSASVEYQNNSNYWKDLFTKYKSESQSFSWFTLYYNNN